MRIIHKTNIASLIVIMGLVYCLSWIFGGTNDQIYVSLIIGLLAFVIINFLNRQIILDNIGHLEQAASDLSSGNLDAEIKPRSKDELGKLAEYFEKIRLLLKSGANDRMQFNESLESKVKERITDLTNEKERLLASIESLSFGFAITGTDKRITLANAAIYKIFGNREGELSLSQMDQYLGSAFSIEKAYEQCFTSKTGVVGEHIDFNNRIYNISLLPIIVGLGPDTIGAVLLFDDVTGSVLLERSKNEFLAVASHELRTPLTSIKGTMSLILDYFPLKIDQEYLIKLVKQSHDSADRLIHIVNDFLDISRLEQNREFLHNKDFDLNNLIKATLSEVEGMAQAKQLTIVFEDGKDMGAWVAADPDRIKQVLFNLLGNAINYTDKGSITVRLLDDGKSYKVYVEDTGIGIPEMNQGLLFHKFQQAGKDYLARKVSESTGMGLYISKFLIEKMGGTIGLLTSKEGFGSTFYFSLPKK